MTHIPTGLPGTTPVFDVAIKPANCIVFIIINVLKISLEFLIPRFGQESKQLKISQCASFSMTRIKQGDCLTRSCELVVKAFPHSP